MPGYESLLQIFGKAAVLDSPIAKVIHLAVAARATCLGEVWGGPDGRFGQAENGRKSRFCRQHGIDVDCVTCAKKGAV